MEKKDKSIDVREAIRSKNPLLAKWLPAFVINYIKRIVHQDEVNVFIKKHGDKSSFAFVDAVVDEFKITVKVIGEENIFTKGGCVYAANHPLGGLDALALMQVLALRRRDLKFIVNDILLQIKNLADLFIGVNKHGKNAAASLDAIDNLYASDKATLIFPAGLVSRKQNGIIKDLTWKKSFIVKAKKHNRKIVPVHIEGKNSNWFYGLSNWRKHFGIEANIEMLYLMDEMYHQHGNTITITFGKPIAPDVFKDAATDVEWANRVREHIYIIAKEAGAVFK